MASVHPRDTADPLQIWRLLSIMTAMLDIGSIEYDNFRAILQRYTSVAPSKLAELDEQRYTGIPEALAKLTKAGEAHLTSDQLVSLVEWKV